MYQTKAPAATLSILSTINAPRMTLSQRLFPDAKKRTFRAVILGTETPPNTNAVTGAETIAEAMPIIKPEMIALYSFSNIFSLTKMKATIPMAICVPI